MKLKIAAVLVIAMLSAIGSAHAERRGPSGHTSRTFGPNGGGSAEGSRAVQGPRATSAFSAAGPKGHGLSGSASSTVAGGKGSGEATLQTTGSKSATLQGQGQLTPSGASGSGSITTGAGRSVAGSGDVTKTGSGISASGSATTGSGKSAGATIEGNKEGGTATITTDQGSKTVDYGGHRN